jgi:hypothetical protein
VILAALVWQPAAAQQAAAAKKTGLTQYAETVTLGEDGKADVSVQAKLANWTEKYLDLPAGYAGMEGLKAEVNGAEVNAETVKDGSVSLLRLTLPDALPEESTVGLTFTAPKYYNWSDKKVLKPYHVNQLGHTFSNTTRYAVGNYSATIVLPPHWVVNSVASSVPASKADDIVSPYDFTTGGDVTRVLLRSKSVAPGKTAEIVFGMAKDGRNTTLALLVGLLVIAGALWLKRDVLTREDFKAKTAS